MPNLYHSGPWVGFYLYDGRSRRFLMDLHLRFQNGKIEGDDADGLDMFTIAGVYDNQKRECSWQKVYPTRPAVSYGGYREGKGIWGRWKLSTAQGGFHIWPLKEGGPPDLQHWEEEKIQETVEYAPVLIPSDQ